MRVIVVHFRIDNYEKASRGSAKKPLEATTDELERIVNNAPRMKHEPLSTVPFIDLIGSAITDKTGTARFKLKAEGRFDIRVDNPGPADFADATLEVSKRAKRADLAFQ